MQFIQSILFNCNYRSFGITGSSASNREWNVGDCDQKSPIRRWELIMLTFPIRRWTKNVDISNTNLRTESIEIFNTFLRTINDQKLWYDQKLWDAFDMILSNGSFNW
jgi:hypothetical protein